LFLDRVAGCLPWTTPLAAAIDAKALERDPSLPRPALREAKRELLAGNSAAAIAILRDQPEPDATTRLVLAQAYLQDGEAKTAGETLAPLVQQRRATAETLRTALAIQIALGDDTRVRSLASRLRAQALEQGTPLTDIDMLLGALYEEAGEYPLSLVAYRRASRSGGSRKSLESIARVSALSGDAAGALITYRRLCRADGGVGDACRTAEKLSTGEVP
jgi:tetratricopeptide (TPR) repeat protein